MAYVVARAILLGHPVVTTRFPDESVITHRFVKSCGFERVSTQRELGSLLFTYQLPLYNGTTWWQDQFKTLRSLGWRFVFTDLEFTEEKFEENVDLFDQMGLYPLKREVKSSRKNFLEGSPE